MREKILEAYCVELDRVVDIEEAEDAYFAQPEPRTRFTFLCSDETCRSLAQPPFITGVNYSNKHSEKAPHFRRNKEYTHSHECIWGHYNAILQKILTDKVKKKQYLIESDKNIFREFKDINSADVFDELIIKKKREKIVHNKTDNISKNIINRIIFEKHKTYSLSNVVDIFRKLNDEQKSSAMISLPDLPHNNLQLSYSKTPRCTYEKAFKPVSYIRNFYHWTHVYYGSVKIYKYSKNIQGYKLFFQNIFCDYYQNNINYKVSAFIYETFFDNTHKSKELRNNLDYYTKNNEKCCCYILANATHLQKSASSGCESTDAEVMLDVFDIVLRETTPKCR